MSYNISKTSIDSRPFGDMTGVLVDCKTLDEMPFVWILKTREICWKCPPLRWATSYGWIVLCMNRKLKHARVAESAPLLGKSTTFSHLLCFSLFPFVFQGQRLLQLGVGAPVATGAGTYSVTSTSPPSNVIAPSSYYMLFAVANGAPSTASWISIG